MQNNEIPNINPLDEAVNEKKYSQPNINTTGIDLNTPIEEPKYTPPPFQKKTTGTSGTASKFREKKPEQEPFNPEMKNLSKKDTEMAAAQAASLILNGYDWISGLANKALVVSEKKLAKLQTEGEINLNAMIDYDYGKKIRAGDFFKEYNEQVADVLKPTDEFKDEVRPILERVLAKRGIGMTDEQMLIFLFGKNIAAQGFVFLQYKQQLKHMIESIKESTKNQEFMNQPQTQYYQQQQTQYQPQPTQPEPTYQEPQPKPEIVKAEPPKPEVEEVEAIEEDYQEPEEKDFGMIAIPNDKK